ncbi:hypothetical protein ONZ45_g2034 [Pleurotus djamor]|nr:hypothetical protein ONZ45_g2034 [Pleurotus djamor]
MSTVLSPSSPTSPSRSGREPPPLSPLPTAASASNNAPVLLNIPPPEAPAPPPTIDPELSLELRLRWLEALVLGTKPGEGGKLKPGETIPRAVENIQRRLNIAVEGNDALKKFMDHYEQNAAFLSSSFALSGTLPSEPAASFLSEEELDALLTDVAPDVRSADHDMSEIVTLVNTKNVMATGKLGDYEPLEPRVKQVMEAYMEDIRTLSGLEKRVARLVEKNATLVDALSELFVVWDETLTDAEVKLAKIQRTREERRKLGIE